MDSDNQSHFDISNDTEPTPLSVIIIDDNPVERALLSGLLKKVKRWTITSIQCASGEEAQEILCDTLPHVIFVDYRLRNEMGTDVIRRFRQAGCPAAFILFTGTGGEEALLEALHASADDYLHKTDISLESVNRVLHHSLERIKSSQALMSAMDALRQAKEALEDRVVARTSQLKAAREKLDIITSAALDPILLLDANARIIFWNPAAENIFGYSADEILGQEVYILLPPSSFKDDLIQSYRHFSQTGQGTMIGQVNEFTVLHKNGDTFPVSASIAPIQQSDGWHAVVIPRDITRRQATETALRLAKEEAERATQLKDQFVSLVAHDLRGPFTTILGFLNLLDNDKKHPLSKKQKGFLRWVLDSSEKMVQMIDEILNISRLKTGKITPLFRFSNAHFLCETLIENIMPLAEKKGITLQNSVPDNCRIYSDPDLFGEVMRNLLSNAVKFCKNGDQITLLCPDNEPSTLMVKDTGVGISEKRALKLFKLEEKTSTTGTGGEHGTGFGLPFSMDLMKAHGGHLSVESTEGKGSIFYASLPEVIPQVLLVDDDVGFRLLLRNNLKKERVTIFEAENGIRALALLEERSFHLIIGDIQMPGMDGLEFLKELRSKPETKSITTILITGDKSISIREKAFQLGADDFITKPFDYADFLPRVRRFLG